MTHRRNFGNFFTRLIQNANQDIPIQENQIDHIINTLQDQNKNQNQNVSNLIHTPVKNTEPKKQKQPQKQDKSNITSKYVHKKKVTQQKTLTKNKITIKGNEKIQKTEKKVVEDNNNTFSKNDTKNSSIYVKGQKRQEEKTRMKLKLGFIINKIQEQGQIASVSSFNPNKQEENQNLKKKEQKKEQKKQQKKEQQKGFFSWFFSSQKRQVEKQTEKPTNKNINQQNNQKMQIINNNQKPIQKIDQKQAKFEKKIQRNNKVQNKNQKIYENKNKSNQMVVPIFNQKKEQHKIIQKSQQQEIIQSQKIEKKQYLIKQKTQNDIQISKTFRKRQRIIQTPKNKDDRQKNIQRQDNKKYLQAHQKTDYKRDQKKPQLSKQFQSFPILSQHFVQKNQDKYSNRSNRLDYMNPNYPPNSISQNVSIDYTRINNDILSQYKNQDKKKDHISRARTQLQGHLRYLQKPYSSINNQQQRSYNQEQLNNHQLKSIKVHPDIIDLAINRASNQSTKHKYLHKAVQQEIKKQIMFSPSLQQKIQLLRKKQNPNSHQTISY